MLREICKRFLWIGACKKNPKSVLNPLIMHAHLHQLLLSKKHSFWKNVLQMRPSLGTCIFNLSSTGMPLNSCAKVRVKTKMSYICISDILRIFCLATRACCTYTRVSIYSEKTKCFWLWYFYLLRYIHTAREWDRDREQDKCILIHYAEMSHWFETGTRTRTHCFPLRQSCSLYHCRSRSRVVWLISHYTFSLHNKTCHTRQQAYG